MRGDEQKRHLLFVSESGVEQLQSTIDLQNPGELQVAYTKTLFASLLFKEPQKRMLVIGLGGGGMIRFVDENFSETTIEAVEIDPAVVRIAAEYFETKPKPGVVIHTEDAFNFLARPQEPFDAIYLDAFLRPSVDADSNGENSSTQNGRVSRDDARPIDARRAPGLQPDHLAQYHFQRSRFATQRVPYRGRIPRPGNRQPCRYRITKEAFDLAGGTHETRRGVDDYPP